MNEIHRSNPARIEEPFRLFFPVGMAVGLAGVLLWPLFYAGWLTHYPGIVHTRLMIQGFAGLFIFGFLMTAGPRLLGVPSFTRLQVLRILAIASLACLAQLFNRNVVGDLLFAAAIGTILIDTKSAFAQRQDTPPPGFPLAALGLFCGGLGSLALAASASVLPNATLFKLGNILLFQGFTLLPIIGVGAFFFPKLLASRNQHDFPEMRMPNREWKRRFAKSLWVALFFGLSIVLELTDWTRSAYTLRLAAFALYLLSEIPFREFNAQRAKHGLHLIIALSTIAIGLAGVALFPGQRIAWLHAYFLTGLTSVIFLVSLRVVFGHSERPDLIRKSIKASAWVTLSLIVAAIIRILADYSPNLRTNHYLIAAIVWLTCGLAWMIFVAPITYRHHAENSSGC